MFERIKFWVVIVAAFFILLYILPLHSIQDEIKYFFYSKEDLRLHFSPVNPTVKSLSSDPSNKFVLKVQVRDPEGQPVPKARVVCSVDEGIGSIYPMDVRTDASGDAFVTYIPPSSSSIYNEGKTDVTLNASIDHSDIFSQVHISLVPIPLLFIHGYQEAPEIFVILKDYLDTQGFQSNLFAYPSEDGIVKASISLASYLEERKLDYLAKGQQVGAFDLVTHSMGGLVARYYTCSEEYAVKNNVHKMIFLSVPHQGSYAATLGANYLNDQGIKDLIPGNNLLKDTLPNMLNQGLHPRIQVGNILGQFDEVVSPENADLEEWGIKTELFNVGDNNFTVDNLLNGALMKAPNHNNILNNKKVFERIKEMLQQDLPTPSEK